VPISCPRSVLARRPGVGVRHPRDTEIENLGLARFIHEDIAGLEIAMNDAALMSVLHGVADSHHDFQASAYAEMMRCRVFAQRLTVDELHREVGLRAGLRIGRPRFVDLSDAGVL
jgi:hypothetical protein